MKRLICAVLILLLPCCALAEAPLLLVTPMPSAAPAPAGEQFSCEAFFATLPAGLKILTDAELEGYIAAAESVFPDMGQVVLAAMDAGRGAALCFSLADSALDPMSAAREAALALACAEPASQQHGANACACISCSYGELDMRVYFLSNGNQLLSISACGLSEPELSALLASIEF